MDWVPIQIMEITLFLSKAHNWKSPGSDQIQNYWLTSIPSFPQAYYEEVQCNNGGTGEGT